MMDCCKLLFNILASILILMGLGLAILGFYGSTLQEERDAKIINDGTNKYNTQLKVAFFGIAMIGLGAIGLAILGLIAVNCGYKLLIIIFRIALISIAVLLLALAGLAFGAVYLRTSAFKEFWRPKMELYDPKNLLNVDFIEVQVLQTRVPCCGLSDEDVYKKYADDLPFSCCGVNPIPFKKCTKEVVKSSGRKPCDEAENKSFIITGKIISYGSCIVALYLISLVILACCINRRD